MRVWILQEDDYDAQDIRGVFATRAAALAALAAEVAKDEANDDYVRMCIEEYTVTEES